MQNKSSNLTALWFIPLVAVLLAAFFTFVFVVGKAIYKVANKSSTPLANAVQPVQPVASVVPFVELEETQETTLPPEVAADVQEENVPPVPDALPPAPGAGVSPRTDHCPAPSVPAKIEKKPNRTQPHTPFRRGLQECLAEGIFPCAWEEDNARIVTGTSWGKNGEGKPRLDRYVGFANKQFWVMSAQGPIKRGVYDMQTGKLIQETLASINGTVTQVMQGPITWYFEGGVLTKIRTTPYDNCNLHDWFFIDAAGNQDVCQCAYNQPDCCARSPYIKGMPREYCEIFLGIDDFCLK